eukprot:CAMPEP_0202913566 /NCGR_PEP_ID=MMETSP1392-20130828/60828_1 /ASSEMBLY_ACC=CAM_ASM_000868 /TAXON_ID=225041 /ORGANISM="Chlamydomonas chlamydogama, Strain SAG 11-48b" /LENGTH=75 /DNA_ID=CAMNT_0049604865 /DNA_START=226 /DNA_END=449 /DNA_ORIENTATION=+
MIPVETFNGTDPSGAESADKLTLPSLAQSSPPGTPTTPNGNGRSGSAPYKLGNAQVTLSPGSTKPGDMSSSGHRP